MTSCVGKDLTVLVTILSCVKKNILGILQNLIYNSLIEGEKKQVFKNGWSFWYIKSICPPLCTKHESLVVKWIYIYYKVQNWFRLHVYFSNSTNGLKCISLLCTYWIPHASTQGLSSISHTYKHIANSGVFFKGREKTIRCHVSVFFFLSLSLFLPLFFNYFCFFR